MGNQGNISAGDVQWMTAGSGIIHQEMPKGNYKGEMLGFQLWANLPAKSKMMDPRYQEIKNKEIPLIKTPDGASVRIICGEKNGTRGPAQDIMASPEYFDITVPAHKSFQHLVKPGYNVMAYVIDGEAFFDERREPYALNAEGENYFDMKSPCIFGNGTFILFEREGSYITVNTDAKSVRFLLFSGKPLNEPIAWYGPIVMNTRAELQKAFEEYQNGSFIKGK
jgi:redox-sensitive bicupin YhaK (pirin superfamily)